jgi:hypothetical protein
MQSSTVEVIRSVLKTDVTITPRDRAEILELLRNGKPAPEQPANTGPTVLRRIEVARRLGRTLRSVDQLAVEGVLKKVVLPGRQRSAGILESSLVAAISAAA